MTDKELLELAAKAAGIEIIKFDSIRRDWSWDPLTDDSDALGLAVKLQIDVHHSDSIVVAERLGPKEVGVAESKTNDPYAATRRAIVRAAAEIGKGMK